MLKMLHTGERYINPLTDFGFKNILEQSYNAYRDIKNGMDTAKKEGREEGLVEASKIIAKNLRGIGMPTGQIAQVTGLSIEDIEPL